MQSCLLVAALEMELQATAGRLRQRTCKMTNYMCGPNRFLLQVQAAQKLAGRLPVAAAVACTFLQELSFYSGQQKLGCMLCCFGTLTQ